LLPPPEARPDLAGGRGVRRDFQCEFTHFPVGTIWGRSDPLTRTDPGSRPIDQLDPATDGGSDLISNVIIIRPIEASH
jgi:hypothetical protein